jgi:hypothetical protein
MKRLDWDMPLRKLLGAVEVKKSQPTIKYSKCFPGSLQIAEFMSINENFGDEQVESTSILDQFLESGSQCLFTYTCH